MISIIQERVVYLSLSVTRLDIRHCTQTTHVLDEKKVTHPATNRTQCWATLLSETNVL